MNTKQYFFNLLYLIIGLTALTNSYADDRALLVGIDKYQYISPLIGSKQDVETMRQFIQTEWHYQPRQIRVLTDAQATRAGILAAFDDWLIGGSQPGDKVLFFYTGHGAFIADENGDEADHRDETLCPVDTTVKKQNMILDDEIDQRLQRLSGRKVTLIIDACHSGTITKSLFGGKKRVDLTVKSPLFASGPYISYNRSSNRKNAFPTPNTSTAKQLVEPHSHVITYTAVAANQEALVDTSVYPNMGVFTRRFLAGVKDKQADRDRDGQITHQELLEYLQQQSTAYCDSHPGQCGENGLTPQLASAAYLKNTDINQWLALPAPDSMPDSMPTPVRPPRVSSTPAPKLTPLSTSLRLQVQPSAKLAPGQRMRIKITSQNTGYLLLFDASTTDHEIQQIFPNAHSQDKTPRMIAGKPRIIPDLYDGFELTATPVTGKKYFLALLTPDAGQVRSLERRLPQIFRRLNTQNAQTLIQQLNQQLQPELTTVDFGIVDYEVTQP
jgi:hypothetical protein